MSHSEHILIESHRVVRALEHILDAREKIAHLRAAADAAWAEAKATGTEAGKRKSSEVHACAAELQKQLDSVLDSAINL